MVRRVRRGRATQRVVRVLRRAARLLVALTVLLTVFGGAAAPAAAAIAVLVDAPACACPHEDDGEKKSCPCCSREDGDGHCLPIGPGNTGPASLAPPALADSLVPLPPLVGIAAALEVADLAGRTAALRLDRPPRA